LAANNELIAKRIKLPECIAVSYKMAEGQEKTVSNHEI
jgi:hypothetical protein